MNQTNAYKLLHDGTLALERAESAGIRVDVDYLEIKISHIGRQMDYLEREFKESKFYTQWKRYHGGDPNPNSTVQLRKYLYTFKNKRPPKLTDKGFGSVDKESLESLKIPELDILLEIRQMKKNRDYLLGFQREQEGGWLHPNFNLHLVRTFRSCVAKGTKILVMRDFTKSPDGVPIENVKAGDFVYCFDDQLKPAIQKVLWTGKTGHREIIRVHYSVNGGGSGYLDVTPEHKIRLIDGSYEQAENLVGDFRKSTESKHLPKIRVLSCARSGDRLKFTGHLKYGKGVLESHLVYEHFYGPLKNNEIIHHKDHNHFNHTPNNLEKTMLPDHSRYHGINMSEERRQQCVKILNANRYKIKYKRGSDNEQSLKLTKYQCLKVLAENGGRLTQTPYDFSTFKKYLEIHGISPKNVKLRYNHKGEYISRGLLLKLEHKGRSRIQTELGINYYTLKQLYRVYNLDFEKRKWANQFGEFVPGNHTITKIEWIGKKADVYDLEVERYHNFIANEICIHNSSDHPNFQNIPKRDKEAMKLTRRALLPRPGHQLLEVDYSGLEVRIAACYHKDPVMIKYLKEGFDMHADMAKEIFFLKDFDKSKPEHDYLRGAVKNGFVFPQFYGDYWRNCAENMACNWGKLPKGRWKPGLGVQVSDGVFLSDHLIHNGIKSLDSFGSHIEIIEKDFWGRRFRVYARWKEKWWHDYQKTGYVDLLTGFSCKGVMGKNDAINYPVQGSAFHCLLWSLIQLDKALYPEWESRIIGQVHDSIVLDVFPPERLALIQMIRQITTRDLPKEWPWIIVPLEVDFEICEVDEPWSEKKELKIV
jgi:hypothetical protein